VNTFLPAVRHARRRPNGFIVVVVLWILAALATLASIYAIYVIDTAKALGVNDDRLKAQALAEAGIEALAYNMTASRVRPIQGALTFRLGAADVTVRFVTETARIDLNAAPKELIAGLFASLGVKSELALAYAERVVGWRSPPVPSRDTETSDYRTAGLRHVPRGAPFPHGDELSLVLGLPADLIERAMPYLTVYSGQPQVNVLAAAAPTIAALPGMTPQMLYAILEQRRSATDPQALALLLGPVQAFTTTEGGKTTRANVRVQFDGSRQMNYEIVLLFADNDPEPYRILSWRDVHE
jgi:general secretion pathway protein K